MQHRQKGGATGRGEKAPQMVKRKEKGSSAVVSEQSCLSLRPTPCWEVSHRPRPRSAHLTAAVVSIQRIEFGGWK